MEKVFSNTNQTFFLQCIGHHLNFQNHLCPLCFSAVIDYTWRVASSQKGPPTDGILKGKSQIRESECVRKRIKGKKHHQSHPLVHLLKRNRWMKFTKSVVNASCWRKAKATGGSLRKVQRCLERSTFLASLPLECACTAGLT